jgi:hypothetical protein
MRHLPAVSTVPTVSGAEVSIVMSFSTGRGCGRLIEKTREAARRMRDAL